jgi:hypothetical protein
VPADRPGAALPRWLGRALPDLTRASAGPERVRVFWIDGLTMLDRTGVHLEAGEMIWLKVDGVLGWGDVETAQPLGWNYRATGRPPVALAPHAIAGGVARPLTRQWSLFLAERSGELEIWLHDAPHRHTPGRDALLFPSRGQGLIAVSMRRP